MLLVAASLLLATLSWLMQRGLGSSLRSERMYYFLLAPGTIIHELCHALACVVTLTPIYRIQLFRVRQSEDGSVRLGEVIHGDKGPIRNFFIAVAPLIGITAGIYLLAVLLLPDELRWTELVSSGWTYVFLVAVFFLALGMCPSGQDLKATPMFLLAVTVLGVIAYFIVRQAVPENDLNDAMNAIEGFLRSLNAGLLLVIVAVAVVFGLTTAIGWARSRNR